MIVKDRMTKNPYTVNSDASLADARDLIKREKVDSLPVVDKKGHLVGLVTEKDVLYASPSNCTTLDVFEIHTLFAQMTVADVMNTEPLTLSPDTHVEDAARLIQENNVDGVCVTDGELLVGIITESDLLSVFMELFSAHRKGVRATALCPQERGELAKLSNALYDGGADILAFCNTRGDDMTKEMVVIKATGLSIKEMKKIIKPYVLDIIEVVEL
ncbi:MAG: CBS domain-containing protein [Spirochaetales bacterium]|nr:CBS domain-containing protein [Spirochaetales bacterium]